MFIDFYLVFRLIVEFRVSCLSTHARAMASSLRLFTLSFILLLSIFIHIEARTVRIPIYADHCFIKLSFSY